MVRQEVIAIDEPDDSVRQAISPGFKPEDLIVLNTPRAQEEELSARRREWFNRADCKERTKRDWRYAQGEIAGYQQAAEDYAASRIKERDLDVLKDHDITDFHAIGFQVGYLRKLAEIALF